MNPETFQTWVQGGYWALLIIAAVLLPPFAAIWLGNELFRIITYKLYDKRKRKARRMARIAKRKLRLDSHGGI